MELEGTISYHPDVNSTKFGEIILNLTIQFNESRLTLKGGHVRFGIKFGELRLELDHARLPIRKRGFSHELDNSIQAEIATQKGKELQATMEGSWVATPGIKANIGDKTTNLETEKYTLRVPQISTKGSEDCPSWDFGVRLRERPLIGSKKGELGSLEVSTYPCTVDATFTVCRADIVVTGGEGALWKDIQKKRLAVIERIIFHHCLTSQIQPYMSRVKLCFDPKI